MLDSRTLRTRQRDAARSALLTPPVIPYGTSKCIGTVIDGGAIPTTADKFALFNPTTLGGAEVEGGAGTFSADAGQQVAGIVMGKAPVVGDVLAFAAITGRWVAYKPPGSGGGGGGVPIPVVNCGCATIPSILTVTQIGSGASCSTGAPLLPSGPLVNGPAPAPFTDGGGAFSWWGPVQTTANGDGHYILRCQSGFIIIGFNFTTGPFAGVGGAVFEFAAPTAANTCSPFSMTIQDRTLSAGCPANLWEITG